MRLLRGVLIIVLTQAAAGCGGSGSPSTPSVASPVPQPAPPPTAFQVTGHVGDTANRAIAGASVEVLTGPQAGTSTISDAAGAFALTGVFDDTTRFRATREGHVAATQSFAAIATTRSLYFALEDVAAPVNIAGAYTLTFIADSTCADQLPMDVRTRTYAATIAADVSPGHPANTVLTAALSGASLDTYYNRVFIFVAGDYLSFDLSDNYLVEEVAPETYFAIGGVGEASVGTSGVSTIAASFEGTFDYCVAKSEMSSGDSCAPGEAVAHAQCRSKNHRLILTRR